MSFHAAFDGSAAHKLKKCKQCRCEFIPERPIQTVCGLGCAVQLAKKKSEKIEGGKRKPKKQPLPALIRKADAITSQFIRIKFANKDGNVKCVSCPTVLHWKDAHCAHYVGRASKLTRWMEENLQCACPSCNVYRKEHHMREFTFYMLDFYGREFVDELRELEKKVLCADHVRRLAEDAIKDYSQRLKELENAC